LARSRRANDGPSTRRLRGLGLVLVARRPQSDAGRGAVRRVVSRASLGALSRDRPDAAEGAFHAVCVRRRPRRRSRRHDAARFMSMPPWCGRSAGVLLHMTSLPAGGPGGDALRFAECMSAAGLSVWQILPCGPSATARNPFASASAFAGEPAFVTGAEPVDDVAYARFRDEHADWLEDWALFDALKRLHGGAPWWHWPLPLRRRDAATLARAQVELAGEIEQARITQFRFDFAWSALHRELKALGIRLFGDVPLFVARDSADVWAHRELFEAGADGRLESVVGVPPDAFSETGQLWGLPPYRWDAMAASGYAWWKRRFELQARRHDLLRLDHFRAFAAWWRIPPDAPTAAAGAWVPGPGRAPIDALAP